MKSTLLFLSGLGLGTLLGLLSAPESGRITRRKVKAEADRIVDNAMQRRKLRQKLDELKQEFPS